MNATVRELSDIGMPAIEAKHLGVDGIGLLRGGWVPLSIFDDDYSVRSVKDLATRSTNTTFTVLGDITSYVTLGSPVKFTQDTGGVKYGNVLSISYSAITDLTTVTLFTNDLYIITAETINDLSFGSRANPAGFPTVFPYTTTLGASAGVVSNPVRLITEFKVDYGHIDLWLACGLDLASATAAFLTFSTPVAGFNGPDFQWFGCAKINNTGATEANGIFFINKTGTTGRVYRSAAAAWPIGALHSWNGHCKYRWV